MRIKFPSYSETRCLMMPYIQGDPSSVPETYRSYWDIISNVFVRHGDMGYLTIDESVVEAGKPHRGKRAKTDRALHTEAGRIPGAIYVWGGGGWGGRHAVTLAADTQILLANSIDDSCAIWDAEHFDTSADGDIGHQSSMYPYSAARLMKAGEVHRIGIFTPHESLPVAHSQPRQFLRIVGSGVHGREPYFTKNPFLALEV